MKKKWTARQFLVCSLLTLFHILWQPLETFEQPFSSCRTAEPNVSYTCQLNHLETHLGCTYQERSRIRCRPSFSVTSAGDMAWHRKSRSTPLSKVIQHTSGKILLVRKHKEQTLLHLSITQYPMEFLLGFVNSFSILAVNHENEPLRPCVVMAPERPDFVLSSNVPNIEFHVLVCHRLNIKTNYDKRFRKKLNSQCLLGTYR